MILAVDFDNTICSDAQFGEPNVGAAQKLRWLYTRHTIIIHSVKANTTSGTDAIRGWLAAHSIPFHTIAGKVSADRYIDDKAIEFEDWELVWHRLS